MKTETILNIDGTITTREAKPWRESVRLSDYFKVIPTIDRVLDSELNVQEIPSLKLVRVAL